MKNVSKIINGVIIQGQVAHWAVLGARFQIWSRQFGLTDQESLAWLLVGQGRLGEFQTTQADVESAMLKLNGRLPLMLDFTDEQKREELSFYQKEMLRVQNTIHGVVLQPTEYALEQGYCEEYLPFGDAERIWEKYKKQGLDSLFSRIKI